VFAWVMHVVRVEAGSRWTSSLGTEVAGQAALFWVMWYVLLTVLGRLSGGRLDHPPVEDRPLPVSRRALFCWWRCCSSRSSCPVPLRESLGVAPPWPCRRHERPRSRRSTIRRSRSTPRASRRGTTTPPRQVREVLLGRGFARAAARQYRAHLDQHPTI